LANLDFKPAAPLGTGASLDQFAVGAAAPTAVAPSAVARAEQTALKPATTKRIAAIGAHFDDIELACGGTLAKAVSEGHQVRVIIMSDSSYTSLDGRTGRSADVARTEGLRAARILGIDDLCVFSFPTLSVPDGAASVAALERQFAEFAPDVVFTHWTFDTHQDHRNTALASLASGRRVRSVIAYEPIYPAGRSYVAFRAQCYVDITDTIDVKMAALRAHVTEYRKFGEAWIDGTRARARFRGYEMGTQYAEAFEIIRYELAL
jgi:LmbE family N-acetylglucosaminyl deacetylase